MVQGVEGGAQSATLSQQLSMGTAVQLFAMHCAWTQVSLRVVCAGGS